MSMLYRIKIVADGKFVRYATDEEMKSLRPKADRKGVERFSIGNGLTNPINGEVTKHLRREDVSDTHDVEWGMLTSAKTDVLTPIYDGDIYVDWNTGIDLQATKPEVFELMRDYDNLHPDQFSMIEVIGNVNENPELLEEK